MNIGRTDGRSLVIRILTLATVRLCQYAMTAEIVQPSEYPLTKYWPSVFFLQNAAGLATTSTRRWLSTLATTSTTTIARSCTPAADLGTLQQPTNIVQPSRVRFISLSRLLGERELHELSLVLLDLDCCLLDALVHYQPEDPSGLGLA